jgi:arginyl-tRNA synthetase
MSSRKGNAVFLEDILMEAKQAMLDQMKEVREDSMRACTLSMLARRILANSPRSPIPIVSPTSSACRLSSFRCVCRQCRCAFDGALAQDLTAKRIKNYDFSWERMLQSEGETGPYLQYSHARVCSISRKAGSGVCDLRTTTSRLCAH